MDYLKLILNAWPILWAVPFYFGVMTSVVVVNEMRPIVRALLRSDVPLSATSPLQIVEGGTTATANA